MSAGKASLYVLALAALLTLFGPLIIYANAIAPYRDVAAARAVDWRTLSQRDCRVVRTGAMAGTQNVIADYLTLTCAAADGGENVRDYAIPADTAPRNAAALIGRTLRMRLVSDAYGRLGPSKSDPRWIVSLDDGATPIVAGADMQARYLSVLQPTLTGTLLFALLGLGAFAAGLGIFWWAFGGQQK